MSNRSGCLYLRFIEHYRGSVLQIIIFTAHLLAIISGTNSPSPARSQPSSTLLT